jgi:hypothetical protein
VLLASWGIQPAFRLLGPLSGEPSSDDSAERAGVVAFVVGGSNQVFQKNENAQWTEPPPLWWSDGYLPAVGAGVRLSGSFWVCQVVSYSSGLR